MAKRCDCSAAEAFMESDPAFKVIPLAARMLWLLLIRAMRARSLSVLRFGSSIPGPKEIAMLVSATESEIEPNIATLIEHGLLERDAEGALTSPWLAAQVTRSEINRINGLKGGARRRQQALDRRQGNMPLPIMGGLAAAEAEATRKQTETEPETAGDTASLAERKLTASATVSDDVVQAVGIEAVEAAGWDRASFSGHFGIIRTWLMAGADRELIVSVIERVTARSPGRASGLGYFDKAMRAEIAAYRAPAPATNSAWNAAVEDWKRRGCPGQAPQLSDYVNEAA